MAEYVCGVDQLEWSEHPPLGQFLGRWAECNADFAAIGARGQESARFLSLSDRVPGDLQGEPLWPPHLEHPKPSDWDSIR